MIYINENKYRQNSNSRIGWIICEAAGDPDLAKENTRIVKTMSNGRRVVAETVLITCNLKNRNGRIYSREELFPQLTSERTLDLLSKGQMLAEENHPQTESLQRQAMIDIGRASARHLKFWTEGDLICGQYIGTNNALGERLNQDLLDGFIPMFSLRALGSIENTPRGAEVKNIKLVTFDEVNFQSDYNAFTRGLVYENANYVKNDNGVMVRVDESKQKKILENGLVIPITNQSVIDCIQQESYNFNTITKTFDTLYDSIKLVNEGTCVQISNSQTGDSFLIQLEEFVTNEIRNYCSSR